MLLRINDILSDPLNFLISFLLMLPGACLAISVHESAHGWVAEKCGDPTARYAGRITLNPVKHFDPIGFLCLLFVGFGWAKPVPVNPLLYKNYRKDDIKVSLAGITANLCLFLICFLITQVIFSAAIASTPKYTTTQEYLSALRQDSTEESYRLGGEIYDGESGWLVTKSGYWDAENLYEGSSGLYVFQTGNDATSTIDELIIEPILGKVVAIIYRMLTNCMLINLSLAVFNLIPIPPLDGYHVLNDLVLKQDLFAQRRTQQICMAVLFALIIIGNVNPEWDLISIVINGVRKGIMGGLTSLTRMLAVAVGII
ncbi:MAG: site-2 protease family protein [Clostridia bacterium]|nr:site-2 protease family protein [Clostridia bacterium]